MNLQSIIKKVLKEETNLSFKIRRRTNLIDNEVEKLLRSVYTPNKICKDYTGGIELNAVISHAVIENLYFNTFYEMDDESKEWEEITQSIWDYIHEKYGKEIDNYYHINCV
jgi:hypothetical protein